MVENYSGIVHVRTNRVGGLTVRTSEKKKQKVKSYIKIPHSVEDQRGEDMRTEGSNAKKIDSGEEREVRVAQCLSTMKH